MSTPALNPLVEKLRAKYPGAYDDMDDATLTKKVLAKYPAYADLAAPGASSVPKPPNPLQGVVGYDALGPVKDTFTTRTGQRIESNLNVPGMMEEASKEIKQIPTSQHSVGALVNNVHGALKKVWDDYHDPANIVGDIVTGYVGGKAMGAEMPSESPAPRLQAAPATPAPTGKVVDAAKGFALKQATNYVSREIPVVGKLLRAYDFVRNLRGDTPDAPPIPTPKLDQLANDVLQRIETAKKAGLSDTASQPTSSGSATALLARDRAASATAPFRLSNLGKEDVGTPNPRILAGNQGVRTTPIALLPERGVGQSAQESAMMAREGATPRAELPPQLAPRKSAFGDVREDQAILDAMNADLEAHGAAARTEAGREFAQRNSMDVPKWQRAAQFKAQQVLEDAQRQAEQRAISRLLAKGQPKIPSKAKVGSPTPQTPPETPPAAPAQDTATWLTRNHNDLAKLAPDWERTLVKAKPIGNSQLYMTSPKGEVFHYNAPMHSWENADLTPAELKQLTAPQAKAAAPTVAPAKATYLPQYDKLKDPTYVSHWTGKIVSANPSTKAQVATEMVKESPQLAQSVLERIKAAPGDDPAARTAIEKALGGSEDLTPLLQKSVEAVKAKKAVQSGEVLTKEQFRNLEFTKPEGGSSVTPKTAFDWREKGGLGETLHELSQYPDQFRFQEVLGKGWESEGPTSLHLASLIKANKPITVYRTADIEGPTSGIMPGSYVTESRNYALRHAEANIKSGAAKLYSMKVRPSELMTYGDPHEFIYTPESVEEAYARYLANHKPKKP